MMLIFGAMIYDSTRYVLLKGLMIRPAAYNAFSGTPGRPRFALPASRRRRMLLRAPPHDAARLVTPRASHAAAHATQLEHHADYFSIFSSLMIFA